MGCKECGKPKCNGECGCKSPKVLQINNPAEYITFHKVSIPAAMGDSTTNPPKIGAYRNALVYYEADHTSWMYSTDGIPTKLTNGLTDYNEAVNLPQINGHTLIGNQSSSDLGLQGELTAGNGIDLNGTEIKAKIGDGLEFDSNGEIDIADIEQYAHFFDTVADMQAADLSAGEFAITAGYYAVNDGGGAKYKIANSSETADGGSIIALNNNLKATLIIENGEVNVKQFGAKGDGTTDDSTAINNALSFKGNDKITITFVGSETYLSTGIKYIYSNTTIDLNSSTILGSGDSVWRCDKDSVCSAGYTGINNVVIKNGTFKNETHFSFFHSTNIKVENILFDDAHQAWHIFDLGGVSGFTMKNCEIYGNGNADWSTQVPAIEAIQTDFASQLGQPDWSSIQPNVVYDNIPTRDVLIENCYFHKKDSDTQCSSAIGTHSHDIGAGVTDPIQNVTIRGCKFEGWYKHAITWMKVKNVLIENCEFIPLEQLYSGSAGITAAIRITSSLTNYGTFSTENIVIRNNKMISENDDYDRPFAWLEEYYEDYPSKNIVLSGNLFKCNTADFLVLKNATDIEVRNNNVEACHNFIECTRESITANLNIYDNFVNLKGLNPEFLRSTTNAVSPYWVVNGLNDHNNIVTKVINDTLTTINKSAFVSKCTLDSNKTYSSTSGTFIVFDSASNPLVFPDGNDLKPIRLIRDFKISGRITAKTSSGGSIDSLRLRVWDMVKGEVYEDKTVRFTGISSFTDWQSFELPTIWVHDNNLKVRSNVGPRFACSVFIKTTGSVEVSADDTAVNFYNW